MQIPACEPYSPAAPPSSEPMDPHLHWQHQHRNQPPPHWHYHRRHQLRLPDGNSPPAITFPLPTATPGEPSFRRFPSSPPLPLEESTDSFLIIPPARATDESVLMPPSEVPLPPTLPFFPLVILTTANPPIHSSSV
ncbi:uncharacterized protein LOC131996340 [Stomoxys calcitrans]|uniref:uncharacterized protein LOC131996340 n=1 Tax=Stomoxys calcitrans TaxID=35570 RepID=UPI0027E34CC8|nr:uncharacterized protein LOC131996340 [Stomoxys calcitrans]